jgi:hypothetical protein
MPPRFAVGKPIVRPRCFELVRPTEDELDVRDVAARHASARARARPATTVVTRQRLGPDVETEPFAEPAQRVEGAGASFAEPEILTHRDHLRREIVDQQSLGELVGRKRGERGVERMHDDVEIVGHRLHQRHLPRERRQRRRRRTTQDDGRVRVERQHRRHEPLGARPHDGPLEHGAVPQVDAIEVADRNERATPPPLQGGRAGDGRSSHYFFCAAAISSGRRQTSGTPS